MTRDERGLPATTKSWIDADTYGTTTRTFDPATAVLLSVQKPEQTGTDLATRLQYDSRRLYAEYATNELGHSVHSDVDLATGAARVTEGPEQPDGSWPGGRVDSDGLGRPLRTYVRVDAGGGYDEVLVGTAEYFDAEIPARVRTRQRIELDEDRWIVTDTYVDGLGRTVRQVVHGDEGPAESTYAYDGAGNAISMTAPNPNDEAASPTVTATWEHDALGRVVRVVPPAGAPVVAQYDGLTATRTQVVDDEAAGAGDVAAPVTTRHDVFGRLRAVIEQAADGPAVTTYDYDGNDQLRTVVNADGIVTHMDHDLAGRRTRIRRGARQWVYEYDRNGNLTAAVAPHDDGAPGGYGMTQTFDALDRLTSRWADWRDLELSEQVRFANRERTTHYYYDGAGATSAHNAIGHLSYVDMPIGTTRYDYTALGQVRRAELSFHVNPYWDGATNPFTTGVIGDTRVIEQTYNAMGQPKTTTHGDDAAAPTITTAQYDSRGLPVALWGPAARRRRRRGDGRCFTAT